MTLRRSLAVGAAGLLVAWASGCALAPRIAAQSQDLSNAKGRIQAVNVDNGWYGIVPDADRGTRYAPDRLPDEFRRDGLRVVFSGRLKPVDPADRSWGIPLELTSIRRE